MAGTSKGEDLVIKHNLYPISVTRRKHGSVAFFNNLPQNVKVKIRQESTGCWVWTGATHSPARYPDRKYGYFALPRNGKKFKVASAHRFIYELANGPLLPGIELDVDHKCRNSLCVNPDHLRAITHTDNIRLRVFKRRAQ